MLLPIGNYHPTPTSLPQSVVRRPPRSHPFSAWRALRELLWVALLPLLGCDGFPKDPEHTLDQVRNGTLVVGYSENPPWVVKTTGTPTGPEAELVEAFARTLSARVQWRNDTEQNLFEALERRQVHVVVAGLTDQNPWKEKVAFTRPYMEVGKEKHVLASIQGENAFIVALERFLHQQEAALPPSVQP
ncbi:transporter substrate-binding domain-containing protein [Hymenobacter sp. YC55]|uniref:transporter substrate-binding domain-containing protein n=1 Tax=Hymenobacter sp. YC55 TaxID=3034019 RepID=UPI0023F6E87F|nr:transporter substrate-binding domain-containing protein [Hymenobacter sp. YC55]MDF7811476.1 transporter substrate-binding domain-containing protein [Hymenobacter sp. YC55]